MNPVGDCTPLWPWALLSTPFQMRWWSPFPGLLERLCVCKVIGVSVCPIVFTALKPSDHDGNAVSTLKSRNSQFLAPALISSGGWNTLVELDTCVNTQKEPKYFKTEKKKFQCLLVQGFNLLNVENKMKLCNIWVVFFLWFSALSVLQVKSKIFGTQCKKMIYCSVIGFLKAKWYLCEQPWKMQLL